MTKTAVNLSHLDHLGETVARDEAVCRIVHIYCEAPHYGIVADPDEGTACVDDAARAAIVYLRDFERSGNEQSLTKAVELLRFIQHMQTDDGLFYNFVTNNRLEINRTHHRSVAERVDWWTCRAVWALGVGARTMAEVCPDRSASYIASARRVLPHLRDLARNHPTVERHDDRDWPTWLVHGDAADATSELLLGLIALNEASPSGELTGLIDRFAEGVASMRLGSMNTFPYGLYASTRNGWHAWGNAQTQALAEAGWIDAARAEAESFFPRLIINGLIHSIDFAHPPIVRGFERIAYGARCVALGLLKVFEKTGEDRFAVMAGLAASWLMGNNATGVALYDPRTGRCFDAVESPEAVNRNAGAESTIEALYTLLEIGRHPAASRWLYAVGDPPVRSRCAKTGDELHYRVFRSSGDEGGERVAVVMNLTRETLDVRVGEEVDELLAAAGG